MSLIVSRRDALKICGATLGGLALAGGTAWGAGNELTAVAQPKEQIVLKGGG